MRYNLYANNRTAIAPKQKNHKIFESDRGSSKQKSFAKSKPIVKVVSDGNISERLSILLDLCDQDEVTRLEIIGKLSMYRANLTIAREFRDRKSEKALRAEFADYIDQKIKEKR